MGNTENRRKTEWGTLRIEKAIMLPHRTIIVQKVNKCYYVKRQYIRLIFRGWNVKRWLWNGLMLHLPKIFQVMISRDKKHLIERYSISSSGMYFHYSHSHALISFSFSCRGIILILWYHSHYPAQEFISVHYSHSHALISFILFLNLIAFPFPC